MALPYSRAATVPEGAWESRKNFIKQGFLVDNKSYDELVDDLRKDGLIVTKPQLERRVLAVWGFRKQLSGNDWRYVDEEVRRRAPGMKLDQALDRSLILLSKRPLSKELVIRQVKRNQLVTMGRRVPVRPPDESLDLAVVSPRLLPQLDKNGSPLPDWPRDLPWFIAERTVFPSLLRNMQFAPQSKGLLQQAENHQADVDVRGELIRLARQGTKILNNHDMARLSSVAFTQLARASLQIVLGGEIMSNQLLAHQSVDRIAERFDALFPEAYLDENLARAVTLTRGSPADCQREALRMILYLTANRIVPRPSAEFYREDNAAIVSLCRVSGLDRPRVLQALMRESNHSATLAIVMESLFRAAVNVLAIDFVGLLLALDNRLSPDASGLVEGVSPLCFAVKEGSKDLLQILFRFGADPWRTTDYGRYYRLSDPPRVQSLMALAIVRLPKPVCLQIVQALLEHGVGVERPLARSKVTIGLSALQAAIMMGYTNLVDTLLSSGAELERRSQVPMSAIIPAWPRHPAARIDRSVSHLVTCLALAAGFSSKHKWAIDIYGLGHEKIEDDQEQALLHCQHVVTTYYSSRNRPLSPRLLKNSIVAAAAQGYNKVVRYLHGLAPLEINLDPIDPSELPPLLGPVICRHTATCGLILDLGATADATIFGYTTALQIATCLGHSDIVKFLLDHGASANTRLLVHDLSPWPKPDAPAIRFPVNICWDNYDMHIRATPITVVRTAILCGHWQAAMSLIDRGATVTGTDLVMAAGLGQCHVVRTLTSGARKSSVQAPKQRVLTLALRKAVENGRVEVAKLLHGLCSGQSYSSVFRFESNIQAIQRFIPTRDLQHPSSLRPDAESRSYLENAIISLNQEIIQFALALRPSVYCPGALCAAVMAVCLGFLPNDFLIGELLRRRRLSIQDSTTKAHPALENATLAIAIVYQRSDIVAWLLSVFQHCDDNVGIDVYEIDLLEMPPKFRSDWTHLWTVDPRRQRRWLQLILLALKRQDNIILQQLLEAGYKVDGLSLGVAIEHMQPLSTISKMVEHCGDIDGAQTSIASMVRVFTSRGCRTKDLIVQAPLQIAVARDRSDVVEILLAHGARLHFGLRNDIYRPVEFRAWMPLEIATQNNNFPMVKLLIKYGADPNRLNWSRNNPNRFDLTALQIAANAGFIGIVRYLLANGADPLAPRPFRRLIRLECSGDEVGDFEDSALEGAVRNQRIDTVHLLLHCGADWVGRGRYQYSRALEIASASGYQAILQVFKDKRLRTLGQSSLSIDYCGLAEYPPGELLEVLFPAKTHLNYRRFQGWFGEIVDIVGQNVNIVASTTRQSRSSAFDEAGALARSCIEELVPDEPWCCIPGARSWQKTDYTPTASADTFSIDSESLSESSAEEEAQRNWWQQHGIRVISSPDYAESEHSGQVVEAEDICVSSARRRIDAVSKAIDTWAVDKISAWRATCIIDKSWERDADEAVESWNTLTNEAPEMIFPGSDAVGVQEWLVNTNLDLPVVPDDLEQLDMTEAVASLEPQSHMRHENSEDILIDIEGDVFHSLEGHELCKYEIAPNPDAESWFQSRRATHRATVIQEEEEQREEVDSLQCWV